MPERLNSRKLKVPVTNLLKKVFSKERLFTYVDIGVGDSGLNERGREGGLKVDLLLESCPDGIRAKGAIEGDVIMECTRCLEEYGCKLRVDVDDFFRRPGLGMINEDGRRQSPGVEVAEEDDYTIKEGAIDLNLLVNDAVMLNLPIKHLCREDCKGLCQVCGRNLNEGDCRCERESIDPRLEVLRVLLDREDS